MSKIKYKNLSMRITEKLLKEQKVVDIDNAVQCHWCDTLVNSDVGVWRYADGINICELCMDKSIINDYKCEVCGLNFQVKNNDGYVDGDLRELQNGGYLCDSCADDCTDIDNNSIVFCETCGQPFDYSKQPSSIVDEADMWYCETCVEKAEQEQEEEHKRKGFKQYHVYINVNVKGSYLVEANNEHDAFVLVQNNIKEQVKQGDVEIKEITAKAE